MADDRKDFPSLTALEQSLIHFDIVIDLLKSPQVLLMNRIRRTSCIRVDIRGPFALMDR